MITRGSLGGMRRPWLVMLVVLLGQGCAAFDLTKRQWSQAIIESPGDGGWTMTADGRLAGHGLTIEVVPHNERPAARLFFVAAVLPFPLPLPPIPLPTRAEPVASTFLVRLTLEPQRASFVFHPGRVTLRLGPEQSLRAKVFDVSTGDTEPGDPVPVIRWSRFWLVFDTPPPRPDEPFVLLIDGLEHGGRPFPVPPIGFRKASDWRTY